MLSTNKNREIIALIDKNETFTLWKWFIKTTNKRKSEMCLERSIKEIDKLLE